jgi:hypothetical protein
MPRRRNHNRRLMRRVRNTGVINLETNPSLASVQTPRVDAELPRTRKFDRGLTSTTPMFQTVFFGLRTAINRWRSIKSNTAIPTYRDMSNATRSQILHVIFTLGAAPSTVVARMVGLTARQVGAIRRWNIPDWRDLTNRHVNRAHNINRVIQQR